MFGFLGISSSSEAQPDKNSMRQQAAEVDCKKDTSMTSTDGHKMSSRRPLPATRRSASVDPEPRIRSSAEVNVFRKSKEAEVKGLRSRIDVLQDALHIKESEVKKLRDNSKGIDQAFKEALRLKDEELESLHGRLNGLSTSHRSQEANIKNLTSTISAVECKLRNVNASWTKTQLELSKCRDELFRVQPAAQVSDAEIVEGFESLCQRITNWIDEVISTYEDSHPGAGLERIFSAGHSESASRLLQVFPEAGEHLVRYQIHRHLRRYMLGKDVYMLGLSEEIKRALQIAEEGMEYLEPAKDAATISLWRSETLRALAATRPFDRERCRHVENLTMQLFQELRAIFPAISEQQTSVDKLHYQVMVPASELASKVQLSLSHYDFRMHDEPFQNYVILNPRSLEHHKLIDVKTRKTLKPDSAVVPDSNGHIGRTMIPLEPGLWRVDGGGTQITLKSKAYLVNLFHPVGKRNNKISASK